MNERSPVAVFRADASVQIGGGHVMRCLTLADHMASQGWTISFCTQPESLQIIPKLASSPYTIHELKNPLDAQALKALHPDGCDLCVIDSYDIDEEYEKQLRNWARKIIIIDDLANRKHDCDLLLDQTLGRRPNEYIQLVPNNCQLLLGPEYALLRPQFAKARKDALRRRQRPHTIETILISFGATDPNKLAKRALKGINATGFTGHVDVVMGTDSTDINEIQTLSKSMGFSITPHVAVNDMAALLSRADLAIGAGGTSSWERCCLSVPSLIVIVANNQRMIAEELEKTGATIVLGWHKDITVEIFSEFFSRINSSEHILAEMTNKAQHICDGQGTLRTILKILTPYLANNGLPITLQLATLNDTDIIFKWQSQKQTRHFCRIQEAPSHAEHKRWMLDSTSNPDRLLMLIVYNATPVGVLRFDKTANSDTQEVSLLIAPEKYGLGIASAALKIGRSLKPHDRLMAVIHSQNIASQKLFIRAGYSAISKTCYISEPTPFIL